MKPASPHPIRQARAQSAAPQRLHAAAAHTHAVRIIGGQWKRTLLAVPDQPGLRPTPSRVRETLFNWLGQDLTGQCCLDVFAGTGALGFEAASRGAKKVRLIEQNMALVHQLKRLQAQLHADAVEVVYGDGLGVLGQFDAASVDVVFLDPPFDSALLESALRAAERVVKPAGFVYLEAPKLWDAALLQSLGLRLHRHLRAGAVHAHLLQRLSGVHPSRPSMEPCAGQVG